MKRLVAAVAILAGVAAVALVLFVLRGGDSFTEADAEATVRRALERCDREPREARGVRCEEADDAFSCETGGHFLTTVEEPDPDNPEFSLIC